MREYKQKRLGIWEAFYPLMARSSTPVLACDTNTLSCKFLQQSEALWHLPGVVTDTQEPQYCLFGVSIPSRPHFPGPKGWEGSHFKVDISLSKSSTGLTFVPKDSCSHCLPTCLGSLMLSTPIFLSEMSSHLLLNSGHHSSVPPTTFN